MGGGWQGGNCTARYAVTSTNPSIHPSIHPRPYGVRGEEDKENINMWEQQPKKPRATARGRILHLLDGEIERES